MPRPPAVPALAAATPGEPSASGAGAKASALPVTLKDIARVAGVHLSTVSLVLSQSPKVGAATRERVLRAAARLGYHRDPVYFALSARRGSSRGTQAPPLIVFLTNRTSREDFNLVPHMPGFLAGAQAQAHALGFRCELQMLDDPSLTSAALEARLIARGAQGVILAAFLPHLPQVQLDWSRFALVKIDSWYMTPAVARISYDQQQIVSLACARLYALGYRRIGLAVGRYDEESSDNLYCTGYFLQQHQLNLPSVPPLFFHARETSDTAVKRLGAWVRRHRLDGVVSNWGGVQGLLERAGLHVPAEVGCACLCLHQTDPELAGAVMPHRTVGRKAVETIALLIKTRQFGIPASPPCILVEGAWSDGRSAVPRQPARRRQVAAAV